MPLLLLAGGSVIGWELLTGSDNASPLNWSNVLKVAVIAGAVYLAAKAAKAI